MVRLSELPDPERKNRKKFFKGLETRGGKEIDAAIKRKSTPIPKPKKAKGTAKGRASMRKRSGRTRK